MSRLPDRFDLWVRKARECEDPERQADFILGALVGLKEWHFVNLGTKETPQAARTEIESESYLLVFSDVERIKEVVRERGGISADEVWPVISIPTPIALAWCIDCKVGIFVNPPEDAAMIPLDYLTLFFIEWEKRGARQASGFWIPNMTSEEEDFWQEHGY